MVVHLLYSYVKRLFSWLGSRQQTNFICHFPTAVKLSSGIDNVSFFGNINFSGAQWKILFRILMKHFKCTFRVCTEVWQTVFNNDSWRVFWKVLHPPYLGKTIKNIKACSSWGRGACRKDNRNFTKYLC